MTLTKKDLEESEVKLGSRSKALVPEVVSLQEDDEPNPDVEPEPVKSESEVEPESKSEPETEPEDVGSVMKEIGLDKRFSSPAEVLRAYRELEANHSRNSQDTASLRREFANLAAEIKKPKEHELDDDKINEMFIDNPAGAIKAYLAKNPTVDKLELQALKEEIRQSEDRRVAGEVETFKRSNPDYKKFESQMMEVYSRLPSLQYEPLNEVLPFLLSAVRGSAPAKVETNNNKKNRAETSSGGKRKTATDADPDYDKMSLEELEEQFRHPQ